jgi:hypothetical protein
MVLTNNESNENIYNESKSLALDLETLNNEYKNLLIQYQQAVINYVNYLKQDVSGNDISNNMVQIQGSQYLGTSTLSQNNSPTVDQCQALCASTPGCSGATFNGTNYKQPMCLLRSGDSDIVNGLPTDYAIVPTGKQLLLIVQKINIQLSDTNSQIQEKTTSAEPIYDKLNQEKATENKNLNDQFKQLSVEREKINKMLLDYQTLDETQVEGIIVTNKNYYMYILLCIVSVLVLVLLFKFLATNTTSQNTGYVPQSGGSNIFTRFFNKLF